MEALKIKSNIRMTGPAKKGIRIWHLFRKRYISQSLCIINNICKLNTHNYISLEFHLDSISKFKVSKNNAKFV